MPPAVDDLVSRTAAALAGEMEGLADHLVARMLHEIPELDGDPALVDLLRTSVADNIRVAMTRFSSGERRAEPPETALAYARGLAQAGVPVSALLRAYRLGQAECQQLMIEAFARDTDDPAAIVAATVEFSAATFAYIDGLSEQVVQAHAAERRRWLQSRAAARSAEVATVLAGDALEVGQAERMLGYELGRTHLGLVGWGDTDLLERDVRRVATDLGCLREPLVVPSDAGGVWAWLPLPRGGADPRSVTMSAAGVRLAVGNPGAGLAGFRSTHRQALAARAVALAADEVARTAVTTYADAGLVALLRTDLADLAAWVQGVLGDLAIDDEPHARLRETVRVLLAHQGSHTAAAAELSLHRNTVLYRLRRAEEARGRPLDEGRLDVEVALLACHLLGRRVLC
ncbi:helix-turn-helix domain-containing protein [Nocardioides hankookensis]|uniref:PucR family transcriptional regulator n=1 Tax=Nocardioides hankookensis TaxID=443157 RepID=A0ABW1LKD0_9ACTN